jgi:hypothetical protein
MGRRHDLVKKPLNWRGSSYSVLHRNPTGIIFALSRENKIGLI